MKKKILIFILSICFIIPCMFMFSACSTTTPANIEFKVENGYIQYYDGSNWNNLIAIEELEGEDGDDADIWTIGTDGYWYKNGVKQDQVATGNVGQKGNGIKSIAPSSDPSKTNATQTTYIITLDDNFTCEFVVKNGTDGEDLTAENVTITFNYELHRYFLDYEDIISQSFVDKYSNTSKYTANKGDWVDLYDFSNTPLHDYFLGWYAGTGVNETKITSYTPICDNVTLTAKFDIEKIETEYYTEGLLFGYSTEYSVAASDTDNVKNFNYEKGAYCVTRFNLEDNYSLVFFQGKSRNIVIPKFYNDGVHGELPVVCISHDFVNAQKQYGVPTTYTLGNIDEEIHIIIPEGVEIIERDAFYATNNSKINVEIPSSLKALGDDALNRTTCYFPNDVELEFIGHQALYWVDAYRMDARTDIGVQIGISKDIVFVGETAIVITSLPNEVKTILYIDLTQEECVDTKFKQTFESNQHYEVYFNQSINQ